MDKIRNGANLTPDAIIKLAEIDINQLGNWGKKGDEIVVKKVEGETIFSFTRPEKQEFASFHAKFPKIVGLKKEIGKWETV